MLHPIGAVEHGGPDERPHISRDPAGVSGGHLRVHPDVRRPDAQGDFPAREQAMIYILAAIVAAALLIYLICALLKPEWFQ